MKSVSLIISLYNSNKTCIELIERLRNVISNQYNYKFEFVFVDDASDDLNLAPFQDLIEQGYTVKLIQHKNNQGQIIAIFTGLYYSSGDLAIIMSSDLQDPPELIEEMLSCYENSQSEVVACVRKQRKDALYRRVGAFLWYKFVTLFINPNFPKKGGDYVLLNRRIIDLLLQNTSTVRFLQHEIIQISQKIAFIEYTREANRHRKTEWKIHKIIKLISEILFLQFAPLKLVILMNSVLVIILLVAMFFTNSCFVLIVGLIAIALCNVLFILQMRKFHHRINILFEPEKISEVLLK